ncbi:carbohydrate sulfotransferase 8-like [Chiloscyllium plagiosum]|uniref:carbohydrate sulfotransferase 8-like n=1 Tax=Chiloscyllium plagiosum TaxID=36176 RepID=UPI001CB84D16|nr:carbohydrate sulfotransferase 8-like [Chiloscyllium plagiosum]
MKLHQGDHKGPEVELPWGVLQRPEWGFQQTKPGRPGVELHQEAQGGPELHLRAEERSSVELHQEARPRTGAELHREARPRSRAELRRDARPRSRAELHREARAQAREAAELRRVREVQQTRRRRLSEACVRSWAEEEAGPGPGPGAGAGAGTGALSPQQVSRIWVEDRYRLLYCEVPKAGCSNWKRVLMVLGGQAQTTAQIEHQAAHYSNSLRRLDSFDREGVLLRLRTYTKLLFVREPLERLVSAFRDKFERPNAYYQPLFGSAIIARYRPNATAQALRTGSGLTFPEFVQYLLDPARPLGMDIHWEPVSHLCSPCRIHYDFIGRFERLESEADSALRLLGAPRKLRFPRGNPSTGPSLSHRYLSQLSPADRSRAFHFYRSDYTLFNYPRPPGTLPD